MSILVRAKNWLIGIGAVLLMLISAFFLGRRKEKTEQKAEIAQQRVQDIELRTKIEERNDGLPPAPPQTVATADPKTAAGGLRDAGWIE